jgi:tyrosinase
MATSDTNWQVRLTRIQQILHEAAGGDERAYGGAPLWSLSHDELLLAEIDGVRLIAPEQRATSSCCQKAPPAPAAAAPGRGARSALVQGLRGERPFDGSQYPQLPWGKAPMSLDDLQLVSDWIDDGCPAQDRVIAYDSPVTAGPVDHVLLEAVPDLAGAARHAAVEAPNEYKYQQGELKQRMNIDCMTEAQLDKLRFAMRRLYDLNKWPEDARSYNNLALIHQNHCQHGWERFLTWHRVYLYELEQALQDHCPDVTLPYWDFTMPRYRPEDPASGLIIPRALQAYLTEASLAFLGEHGIPTGELGDLVGVRFATLTRFFDAVKQRIGAGATEGEDRKRFIDALLAANALWYPLRYPSEFLQDGHSSTINKTIHYHYPTAQDLEQILALRTFRDFGGGNLYNDSFGFLDQNPHNTMHIWTGGMNRRHDASTVAPEHRNQGVRVAGRRFHKREDLYSEPKFGDMFSNLTASYDPIFWPIHVNIDRLWWEWQQAHPEGKPADLDAILTPWSYTARDTLDISRFGYEYVRGSYVIPVGVEAPVGRFVSRIIDVPPEVRGGFRQAEVRLHRVPQLPRSCFIRVFLNLPDAGADTPTDHPCFAGYLSVFGHGACYGGPGHCDVPSTPRKFDVRARSHNTPRNHRIDVTKRARALFESGASSVQITLVVIGADYREDSELLRLEGVSLNFLD